MPLPAIRKVPMGIFRERKVVINPKRKITIPTMASSLFTHFPRGFQIAYFGFSLVPVVPPGVGKNKR